MRFHKTSRARRELYIALICFGFTAFIVACATMKVKPNIHSGALASFLKFDHAAHAENADCSDCHGDVAKADKSTRGAFIPKKGHGGCADCHEDEVKKNCEMCHIKGQTKKIELTRVNRLITFSHKKHEEIFKKQGKKESCKHCHAAAYTSKKPGMSLLGKMAVCTDACHKQDIAKQDCGKCHQQLHRQRLEAVAQLGHQGNIIRRHGRHAYKTERCVQCHDQTFCADCHAKTAAMPLSLKYPENIKARFIHRGDFIGRHAVQARANPSTCRKCHGNQYCQSCHQMRGVVRPPIPTANPNKVRRVHGAEWMTPGASNFHGRKARRNAGRCASCHDQGAASNCIRCHKVGALGGNPHPTNFKWADKSGECRSNPMCQSCHISGQGCP